MELVLLFIWLFPLFFMVVLRLLLVGIGKTEPRTAGGGERAPTPEPTGLPIPMFFSKNAERNAGGTLARHDDTQFLRFQLHLEEEQVMVAEFLARPTVERLYRMPDGAQRPL